MVTPMVVHLAGPGGCQDVPRCHSSNKSTELIAKKKAPMKYPQVTAGPSNMGGPLATQGHSDTQTVTETHTHTHTDKAKKARL